MKHLAVMLLGFLLSGLALANQDTHQVFQLINERLGYMEEVALYKVHKQQAVEDLAREAVILEKARLKADSYGLDSSSMEGFFQIQMNAAKAIQYRYRADWLFTPSRRGMPRDLATEIRPELIRQGDQIAKSIRDYLKSGSSFSDDQLNEFLTVVNQENLKPGEKEDIFRALQKVRVSH